MSELAGRHAVVTGGGTGIGLATARRLTAAGAEVTLMARNIERLEHAAATLPGACAVVVDVTDETSVQAAFAQAADNGGPVSILVNNAGAEFTSPVAKTTLAQWNRMLAVNLTGVFLCSRAVLEPMLAQGFGRIVNIASTAGQRGYAYTAAYAASKHGVVGFTRSLALELARKPVTVNCVCPGFTETDLLERSLDNIMRTTGRSRDQAVAELVKFNPQQRLVSPEEVAAAVMWLVSAASAAVTGQSISVSGGEVM